jgi:hypothetical protein
VYWMCRTKFGIAGGTTPRRSRQTWVGPGREHPSRNCKVRRGDTPRAPERLGSSNPHPAVLSQHALRSQVRFLSALPAWLPDHPLQAPGRFLSAPPPVHPSSRQARSVFVSSGPGGVPAEVPVGAPSRFSPPGPRSSSLGGFPSPAGPRG